MKPKRPSKWIMAPTPEERKERLERLQRKMDTAKKSPPPIPS